jgi:hypothetical protein
MAQNEDLTKCTTGKVGGRKSSPLALTGTHTPWEPKSSDTADRVLGLETVAARRKRTNRARSKIEQEKPAPTTNESRTQINE